MVHCIGCHAARERPMSLLILSMASCIFMQLPWDRFCSMLCSAAYHRVHGFWFWLRNHSGSSGCKCRGMRLFVLSTHSGLVSGSSISPGGIGWAGIQKCRAKTLSARDANDKRCTCLHEHLRRMHKTNIDVGTRHILMITCNNQTTMLRFANKQC